MMSKKSKVILLLSIIVGLTPIFNDLVSSNGTFGDNLEFQFSLTDAQLQSYLNQEVTRFGGVVGSPGTDQVISSQSAAKRPIKQSFVLSKTTLAYLERQARQWMVRERSMVSAPRWFMINFSDLLRFNITLNDVKFVNASDVVQELHPIKGFIKTSKINDVYIIKGIITDLDTNEKGFYQFIFTKNVLFGSITLKSKDIWINPIKDLYEYRKIEKSMGFTKHKIIMREYGQEPGQID